MSESATRAVVWDAPSIQADPPFQDILHADSVIEAVEGADKPTVIRQSVDHLAGMHRFDPQFAGSIGVASRGLAFNSLDELPTKLIFLTLSPHDERRQHTELLSRLVSLMSDKSISIELSECRSPGNIYRCLCNLDQLSRESRPSIVPEK